MESLWTATVPETRYDPLPPDGVEVDVAIVGGGLSGIATAYLLKKAGRTVAVIESRRVGSGETGKTTAHLTALQDVGFRQIASRFGKESARRMAEQGMEAIDWIEHISRAEGIDCDFGRIPAYLYTERPGDVRWVRKELAIQAELGLRAERVDEVPLPFKVMAAFRVDHQGRYHPLRFLQGLAERVSGSGSHIFENTHMYSVDEGSPCRVRTSRGTVRAREVAMATDAVTVNRFLLQTKLAPYRTYAIGFRVSQPLDGLFYDTDEPYHYIRTHPTDRGPLLIVGGGDHRVGAQENTLAPYEALERYTRERFPDAGPIEFRWSGQVEEPTDGLPYIGRNAMSSRIYVATGFSGTGMVNSIIASQLLSDLINGKSHPLEKVLAPTRIKPGASFVNFVTENVDYPKHLITDRFPSKVQSLDEVRPGEGQLVSLDGRKLAVYRDEEGGLHALSPVCPHMGCHVHWNVEARSWDCPCHGSRFGCTGEVLHGPSTRGLKAIELEREEEREAPRFEPEEPAAHV